MIYLLKFGASFVLLPGIFFLMAWVLAVYLWKQRLQKTAAALAVMTFIFYLLSTSVVAGNLMADLESVHEQPANPSGDVIIMLGGGATSDTPSLGDKGNLTSNPSARLLLTCELYNRLHVPIILSGGQVYEDSGKEAVIGKRELMRLGVPEDMIIIEANSLTTGQNAKFTAEILAEKGFKSPVLVTSAFHMERSVLNFQKIGVEVVPCSADYIANRQQVFHYNKLMPSADSLYTTNLVFREKLRTLVTRYIE